MATYILVPEKKAMDGSLSETSRYRGANTGGRKAMDELQRGGALHFLGASTGGSSTDKVRQIVRTLDTLNISHEREPVAAVYGEGATHPSRRSIDNACDLHPDSQRNSGADRLLHAIGAMIVDDLDSHQVDDLKNHGVRVIPNRLVALEKPVPQSASSNAASWHLDKINVAAARRLGLEGKGVRVGILDTGIDAEHAEFQGRKIAFMEFDDRGFKISTAPKDSGQHGTHVASLAVGQTCGVAPQADLAVAAVLTNKDPQGNWRGYLAQILAGTNWLLQSNFGDDHTMVDVINASLGGEGFDDYLYDILHLAQAVPAIQMIASVGNRGPLGNSLGSPGNYDIVLGVGATDSKDLIAAFSSWGKVAELADFSKPDLSAPGVNLRGAKPGGGYQLMSGTSMASPIVAGATALIMEKYPDLRRDPSALRRIILKNTVPLWPKNRIGQGRLDLSNI